jgi:hypothetical protein
MLQKKKYIIIVISIIFLIGVVAGAYFYEISRPRNVIENRLKFRLPSDSEIVNYSYDYNGGYFDTKIVIVDKSVSVVKEQLNNFFGGVAPRKAIESMPSFKNTCSWWDLNAQNIEVSYVRFVNEKKWFGYSPKSHQVWAFISKDKEDKYYLYISY